MAKKLLISLVLCLSLFGVASPALAEELQKSSDDMLTKMLAEGWRIVNEGVLQRELKPGKVESFVIGVPGFTWKIQNLRRQLQKLRAEFQAHPTPELRKAIANHQKAIASAERVLEIARTYEALGESNVPKESCIISSFSSPATTGAKTDVQGVWADARAEFSGDCDVLVHAYASAKTGVNGEAGPTVIMTDGPRSATGGPANVHVESNGGAPCEAYAFSEVTIVGTYPPISQSQSSTIVCPPSLGVTVTSNAPSATIDLYNDDCVTIIWDVNISGGLSPYSSTMYLNGVSQNTGTTYSGTWCNAGTNSSVTLNVSATVTDSGDPARSKSGSAPSVTVRSHAKPLVVAVTSNAPSTTIDLYNSDCITIAWATSISGGTSPYTSTMFLNSASQGTRTTYSKNYCNTGTNSSVTAAVSATVTDSGSPVQSKSASAPTITIRNHVKPLAVTVTSNAPSTTIDLYNSDCITITWTTNISGGTSPYSSTMYLNNVSQGTRTTYSKSYCNAKTNTSLTATASATVTDSGSPVQAKSDSAPTITIRSHTVPAPTVTINGPTYLGVTACTTYTWTASVSGGTSPYTYQWTWNGTAVGTGNSYSRSYCPGTTYSDTVHTLALTVTDSASRTGSASKSVEVEKFGGSGPTVCGGGLEPYRPCDDPR